MWAVWEGNPNWHISTSASKRKTEGGRQMKTKKQRNAKKQKTIRHFFINKSAGRDGLVGTLNEKHKKKYSYNDECVCHRNGETGAPDTDTYTDMVHSLVQTERYVPCSLDSLCHFIYRVSQKYVYTRLIFRIIMCIHLFGTPYSLKSEISFTAGVIRLYYLKQQESRSKWTGPNFRMQLHSTREDRVLWIMIKSIQAIRNNTRIFIVCAISVSPDCYVTIQHDSHQKCNSKNARA
jgi:hypothetical protein